ncbi:MAG: long-chain fatty acid--CoA ligase [Alphaproteobacteria bacterium]|nr:long-chain fatty acid--CoA ligase [Alphaproteobacteria bacterium]
MIAPLQNIFTAISNKIKPLEKRYPWLLHYPAGMQWQAEIPLHPVSQLLADAAKNYGQNIAIDFLGQHYTYQEIYRSAQSMAAGLQQRGITKGTRVGLFLPNSPHFIISYYAILMAGGTVVNFNPLYPVRDIVQQIEDANVDMLITFSMRSLLGKLEKCRQQVAIKTLVVARFSEALPFAKRLAFPLVKWKDTMPMPKGAGYVAFETLIAHDAATLKVPEIDAANDVAVLQYTGGTTGVPKGTMLTHANLYANAVQCGMWFAGMESGKERMLGVLPCFHVFAMTVVMNLSVHKGLTMILHPQFVLDDVLKDISRKKPTIMPGVPTMFNAINNHPDVKDYDLTSLKMCISGGAGLPRDIKNGFEKITGCTLIEGYGLSESSPVVAANPLFGVNKTGSIGLPLPDTLLEIVSVETGKPVAMGKTGEICIRGPQVMKGYWQNQDATANTLKNGRLHTGDVGYMDADGYFFVVDRLKEMIISGGYNIYPRNVEEVLYMHEMVLEAAVIGVEDEHWGQRVKAFVALKKGYELSEDALIAFLQDKLPRFAIPSSIEFRESLPKTMIGKISKKEL